MRRSLFAATTVAALFGAAAGSPAAAQGANLPPSVELRVPKAPTIAIGAEGSFLVYELHVTNLGAQPLTLSRVEVSTVAAPSRSLLTLSDSGLTHSIARPGLSAAPAERNRIDGGLRAIVFIWVPIPGTAMPGAIRNIVSFERRGEGTSTTTAIVGTTIPVATDAPLIGPPLRGGPWLAANGPSNTSGHRRALIALGGTPDIAQRFAIDWVKVDDSSSTHHGDPANNANYYAEGNEALAVADGRVVETKDSIPETSLASTHAPCQSPSRP